MKSRLSAVFLTFSIAFLNTAPALAAAPASEQTRFFVQSTSGLMRGALGVRHEFADGFTSDISGFQLQLARLMGVKVFPVKQLTILPADEAFEPDARGGKKPTPSPTESPTPSPSTSVTPTPTPVRPTPSEQVPWGVKSTRGVAGPATGGAGVNVAILDTGITRNHPDLTRRITICKDFTHPKKPVIDDSCDDMNGHGTHVAGIIAADGGEDGLGIYGVAPEASLAVYRVCGNNGLCWADDIASAVTAAVADGANIINMSLGSDAASTLIEDAVAGAAAAQVLVVAAAGNDGPADASIDYPGAFAEVVAVGAVDDLSAVAAWSSRGTNPGPTAGIDDGDIEFAAPGVGIESTYRDGGYALLSGTSMASPHVAGLAALGWIVPSNTAALDVRAWLKTTVIDIAPLGEDTASGFGRPTYVEPAAPEALPSFEIETVELPALTP
jgi:subtilisin